MNAMDGRIVLVTGASERCVQPLCLSLAQRGATLVMAGGGRQLEARALAVRCSTGSAHVHTLTLEVSSLRSVRAAAEHVLSHFPALHGLFLNSLPFAPAQDVGHVMLTNLLLDRMRRSVPPGVVLLATRGTLERLSAANLLQ